MCGITGIFGKGKNKRSRLEQMLEIVSRRGPESTNMVEVTDGLLGHSLLAFVSIGRNNQPLVEGAGKISYNGEVYNWKILNEKYHLRANNDTETLLRGVRQNGTDFLKEIDGQFAFIAEFPSEDGTIRTVVGRDKYGISPLVFGNTNDGDLALASTAEALTRVGIKNIRTVPAGTYGVVSGSNLLLDSWFELPRIALSEQRPADPKQVLEKAVASVQIRIPQQRNILYTTMGGIDSQFITAAVARMTKGDFGGAITVVPWDPKDPDNLKLGDYPEAKATIQMLADEGIKVEHQVVQLNPAYVDNALDRVLKVLGPDYFNVVCGLAEDLVATTAKAKGGKAIMTAGGPDEAGRSYKPWTLLHKDDLEHGFYAVNDQFASSEGVRAGLVFGEQGLENRVPLAHLIEDAMYLLPGEKQQIEDWGDGINSFSIKMKDKVFWRRALEGYLPPASLEKPKTTIHEASGAKVALQTVASHDQAYQLERTKFIERVKERNWTEKLQEDINNLDPRNALLEAQLYCLWRWSKLEPDQFAEGGNKRYNVGLGEPVFYSRELKDKIERPVCYDWMPCRK